MHIINEREIKVLQLEIQRSLPEWEADLRI